MIHIYNVQIHEKTKKKKKITNIMAGIYNV